MGFRLDDETPRLGDWGTGSGGDASVETRVGRGVVGGGDVLG